MKPKHTSIFSLIEQFRKGKQKMINAIQSKTYCDQKSLHDFYCDAERPFVQ